MRSPHPVLHSRASSLLPRSACHSSALKSSTFNTSEFKFQTVFANKQRNKVTTTKPCNTQYFLFLSLWSREVFFFCKSMPHSLSPSLFLSLLSLHGKCSLPSMAPLIFSPTINFHSPCTCHTVSLQPWRSFCQFSDQFPECTKLFDLNTAVFEGLGKPRVPLLLCHLNSFPPLVFWLEHLVHLHSIDRHNSLPFCYIFCGSFCSFSLILYVLMICWFSLVIYFDYLSPIFCISIIFYL